MPDPQIRELSKDTLAGSLDDLTDILHACVHAGASVGFILPFSTNDARTFWQNKIFPAVEAGGRILFVAQRGEKITGTAQLDIDLLPNQAHRAEVAKLLVHPQARRQGIARKLMTALEARARGLGKQLLTLDTKTGDNAEPLYTSLGYQTAGCIPGYCRDALEDRLDATTYMYKTL